MADRGLMVMNWDGLGDDDDQFFESHDRMPSVIAMDMASTCSDDDDDEDYDDSRMSFASCYSAPPAEFRGFITTPTPAPAPEPTPAPARTLVPSMPSIKIPTSIAPMSADYSMWMAAPGSIKERRKRLLQGMGLAAASIKPRLLSIRAPSIKVSPKVEEQEEVIEQLKEPEQKPSSQSIPTFIGRSASDASVASSSLIAQRRMEDLLGVSSKNHLLRTKSQLGNPDSINLSLNGCGIKSNTSVSSLELNEKDDGCVVIKNLDTGKEFVVKEFGDDGRWNRLSELQTGKQLTAEEFEKSVGYSSIVKELLRRENVSNDLSMVVAEQRKAVSMNLQNLNPIIGKSLRNGRRRGAALLKNIKDVANSVTGFIGDKDSLSQMDQRSSNSPWTKVRHHGKSYKELTGLYMSKEIQAHEGSIWTISFSFDTNYLATAGEDRVIHVWQVMECDVMSSAKSPEEGNCSSSSPIHPMAGAIVASQQDGSPPIGEAQVLPSEKKRRGKMSSSSKKGTIPDFVTMPDTVFGLSEKPVCSFEGHQDDVLDLSWSKSQQLLSSSMDKTVRLWDMGSKTCLKLFAHNDYVTCIQFNPIDDNYFISGSLDGKVRLWNIPDRQVVDWTDLNEMVTAARYTPDGQGAIVGSHKGSCRLYDTSEFKLNQKSQLDIQTKKKSQAKKITGFEFAPGKELEVLITSADSRVRVFDGSDIIQKFIGFRNTNSQISASFTVDGKYVVSASEDSHIYVWKHDDTKNVGSGKSKGLITTRSYEQFHCKDVSIAIPWPGCTKYEPPTVSLQAKKNPKRSLLPPLPPSGVSNSNSEDGSMNNSNRKNLPPLPKKNSILERASSCSEEELNKGHFRSDSDISESSSFTSASGSLKDGESCSLSALGNSASASSSSSSSLSWFDAGNSNGNNCIQATAWGLVVVAAGLGGELRIYQNFGVPVRLKSQTNLF
ncbi:hypothetical protein NE237_005014 [Protea cynaroides]|uniref:WD repeat-containing protein 44 n=1 Tax=Protea cynaroides TaxID=273540 RepID=A0A9Q0KK37_9MAGN|nr:hypothetical protein NE237_005014 [Protea cynaroides]